MSPTIVHVDMNPRGSWEIAIPDRDAPITCETYDDARRVGYRWAARWHPCELVVRDAYHRVRVHEFIDGEDRSGAAVR